MLKLIGSVLVFGACTALGLAAQGQLRQRLHALDAMLAALSYLSGELSCRLTPLPTMIEALAASPNRATATVFGALLRRLGEDSGQSLPFQWCCAFRESRDAVGLGAEETAVLCDMAGFLGRYDAQQQLENLQYARGRLLDIRVRVQEEVRVRGNLYRTCGAAIGVMAVLILL